MNDSIVISDGKVGGKHISRIHKSFKVGESDWIAQLNMLLPDGEICKDCHHCKRCVLMFDSKETDQSCQFHPSRYRTTITA